ncbi:hypothetical protein [Mycobacterium sp. 1245111.1]|uniref:hypothetical protein n=1 Tax=Mycobacterium sp. 1245111.1 TaxID=1834073 RepID=UPI000A69134C|nr:hypothetical protein [Mycobacterium sp. 1245111.1]
MQHALRPYATAGVAIVGASIIAVTPVVAPPARVETRPVQLVDAWSDLVTNTTTNLNLIVDNASSSDITQLFDQFLTNPFGVIEAFANFDPTVTTDLGSLPATISVELPPGLELALAGLGATGATLTTLETVAQQIQSGSTNLSDGLATVLNAWLNGTDSISLLNGAITIPLYNGLIAPETSANIDINLPDLINALGLGNTPLTDLDLSSLLNQIGLGDLTLGSLFNDLTLGGDPLSSLGLGTLLGDPTLGTVLDDLGLGGLTSLDGLNLGSFGLPTLLSDLGLNSNLNDVTLANLLDAVGFNTDVNALSLTGVISDLFPNGIDVGGVNLGTLLTELGIGSESVGSLLGPAGITALASTLNGLIAGPLSSVATALNVVLAPLGLSVNDLLSTSELTTALNGISLSSLVDDLTLGSGAASGHLSLTELLADLGLGNTTTGDFGSITGLLTALGINLPSGDFTITSLITDVLNQLGLPIPATGDISLAALLTDLGGVTNSILDTHIGSLLDSLNLGDLLNDLGLSDLPLDLSNLGDLTGLTLSDLLGDLGLGDLANVSVEPLGGFYTLLADVVPGQILASLGM